MKTKVYQYMAYETFQDMPLNLWAKQVTHYAIVIRVSYLIGDLGPVYMEVGDPRWVR